MAEYRWNQQDAAAGYDAGAQLVHPFYIAVQDAILSVLAERETLNLVVDIGGGSGRLLERCLDRWPAVHAVLIDQSPPFLDLARDRLSRFGDRVAFHESRLQDDWGRLLSHAPDAIVSSSAIHHLEPAEKRDLYARCAHTLAAGGVLINGDEIRDPDDATYFAAVKKSAEHMQTLAASGQVSPAMADALLKWQQRNVERFNEPRKSGDDCHETVAVQLDYFRAAGLTNVRTVWQQDMWAVMVGEKSVQ
jgi:tRNA (cmo5U34)-methyltransferase